MSGAGMGTAALTCGGVGDIMAPCDDRDIHSDGGAFCSLSLLSDKRLQYPRNEQKPKEATGVTVASRRPSGGPLGLATPVDWTTQPRGCRTLRAPQKAGQEPTRRTTQTTNGDHVQVAGLVRIKSS